MRTPLASLIRPSDFDEVVGQRKLVGKNGFIRKIIESNKPLPNMILYGPSGTGKTTVANIIASKTQKKIYFLNATTASKKDIDEVINDLNHIDSQNGILLYLDEIQYFTKKQQQTLLEFIEKGDITLIASTTENPYFYIYNAIISRCIIFEFQPVDKHDVVIALNRAIEKYCLLNNCKIDFEDGIVEYLAGTSGGDVRKALNGLEVLLSVSDFYKNTYTLSLQAAKELVISPIHYDKDGDDHYDLLSAFQKSIRGSDPDAAIFYLAKLLVSKDLVSPCRRLLVIASEDIGLAYPQASSIVKSLVDSAMQLGLPEARIPLAEAVIFLATCPKSNSACEAIDLAIEDINNGLGKQVPGHLKDGHYAGANKLDHAVGYLYPHSYKNHYVKQQYLPNDIKNKKYYTYQENKIEEACKKYWDLIKK